MKHAEPLPGANLPASHVVHLGGVAELSYLVPAAQIGSLPVLCEPVELVDEEVLVVCTSGTLSFTKRTSRLITHLPFWPCCPRQSCSRRPRCSSE